MDVVAIVVVAAVAAVVDIPAAVAVAAVVFAVVVSAVAVVAKIYSESSITRSDLIQSSLQTFMDELTLLNAEHRIILSCTNPLGFFFERQKNNKLKPQDVTYNRQVIPSSSVKYIGITSLMSPLLAVIAYLK